MKTRDKMFFSGLPAAVLAAVILASGCAPKTATELPDVPRTIVLGDAGWESLGINNRIARQIIERGYGYRADIFTEEEDRVREGLGTGAVDVLMEYWIYDRDEYGRLLSSGVYAEMAENFRGREGIWVPAYVIEGDAERGIEPMAPGLKTVRDLAAHAELFAGVFHNGVSGWPAVEINRAKFSGYGLDGLYDLVTYDFSAGLDDSLAAAYRAGRPWVGYYWTPSTVMGRYALRLLEEDPFDETVWAESRLCAYPESVVAVVVNGDFPEKFPDLAGFLQNYSPGTGLINELLLRMDREGLTEEESALRFIREREDIWTNWVPAEVAERIR